MKIENKIEAIFISKRYYFPHTPQMGTIKDGITYYCDIPTIMFSKKSSGYLYRKNNMFITTKLANTLLDRL